MKKREKIELFNLSIDTAKARGFRANSEISGKIGRKATLSRSALAEKSLINTA